MLTPAGDASCSRDQGPGECEAQAHEVVDLPAALRELRLILARQPETVRMAVEKHLTSAKFAAPVPAPAGESGGDVGHEEPPARPA